MKKGDIVIALSVLLVAVALFCFLFFGGKKGKTVIIKENNQVVFEGELLADKEVKLSKNTVEIKNGEVDMVYSSCKNQICVKHKKISNENESIICLPNKVIVEIK